MLCRAFIPILIYSSLPLYKSKSIPAKNEKDEKGENLKEAPTDRVPLPEWDRYLKSVSKITLDKKNKEYGQFLKDIDLRKKFEEDGFINDETVRRIEEAFDRLIPAEDKNLLNAVKKKEIDAIRRRIIPRKKSLGPDVELPTHLNMTVLAFTAQDIGLLIKANGEHVRYFEQQNF